MKDYSLYYTPPRLSSFLVDNLSISTPNEVIDICCGSCNLLEAAKKRWNGVKAVGVDVVSINNQSNVIFTRDDGRHFAIASKKKYSLVLANPPFDRVNEEKKYPALYSGVFAKYKTKRLENEMVLANLRLLKKQGTLLIIVPSSVVEAKTNQLFRQIIGNYFFVNKIIRLYQGVFKASHINCFALEIVNSRNSKTATTYCETNCNEGEIRLCNEKYISQSCIKAGNWTGESGDIKKTDAGLVIKRGNISSNMFVTGGKAVLHISKKAETWIPSKRYYDSSRITPSAFVEKGDIVISRIGKSAGQWCCYSGERIAISDCLFCIRDPKGTIYEKIKGCTITPKPKGVATRYITVEDVNKWYNTICSEKS